MKKFQLHHRQPWLFLAFCFLPALVFAPPLEGWKLVKQEVPAFYNALKDNLPNTAHQYLSGWTETDIAFLRAKSRQLLEHTIEQNGPVLTAERLYTRFTSHAFGALGEVYGNVYMRGQLA